MGVSTNGILFYGIVWDDEYEIFKVSDDDWAEVLAKRRGLINPWDSAGPDCNEAWVDAHRGEIDEWSKHRKQIHEEFGVDINHHGSDSWSIPYICVNESLIVARRGYPKPVQSLNCEGYQEKIERFVRELEIDVSAASPCGWYLVSYWG